MVGPRLVRKCTGFKAWEGKVSGSFQLWRIYIFGLECLLTEMEVADSCKTKNATVFKNDCIFFGAQDRTRTCTSLRILVPETSASTNSATWAFLYVENLFVPFSKALQIYKKSLSSNLCQNIFSWNPGYFVSLGIGSKPIFPDFGFFNTKTL